MSAQHSKLPGPRLYTHRLALNLSVENTFNDPEVDEIYRLGGYPSVWKMWKFLWSVLLPLGFALVVYYMIAGPVVVGLLFLGFLAVGGLVIIPSSWYLSPGAEKRRIKKLDAFTNGKVTKHFQGYGMKCFNYTFEVDGKPIKGLDSCRKLPALGSEVRIGYVSKSPRHSKYLSDH